jgi:hypothetical protein
MAGVQAATPTQPIEKEASGSCTASVVLSKRRFVCDEAQDRTGQKGTSASGGLGTLPGNPCTPASWRLSALRPTVAIRPSATFLVVPKKVCFASKQPSSPATEREANQRETHVCETNAMIDAKRLEPGTVHKCKAAPRQARPTKEAL